jgi:hypothetical protein
MFDGTTVSMPDTPESQAEYPQVYNQKPGLGFPIARVCTIISLSCGAVLDLGICRYAGKGQGEVSQLRNLWDILSPGDVLFTDALMSTWYPRKAEPMTKPRCELKRLMRQGVSKI